MLPVTYSQQYTTPEHTPDCPYCARLDCTCHTSVEYHQQIAAMLPTFTNQDLQTARNFFGITEEKNA